MKDISNYKRSKLFSALAVTVAAAIVAGGTGGRTRVSAVSDDALLNSRGVSIDVDEPSEVYRSTPLYDYDVPMTVGTASYEYGGKTRRVVPVFVDGTAYSGTAFLYKDTTYVGFREFSVAVAGAEVTWNQGTSTATARTAKVTVNATKGKEYVSSNGRYFWARTGIIINDGTMYVPVRAIAAAFGASVQWNSADSSVSVTRGSGAVVSGASYYDADEVYWLSKIIHAESRGEPMTGKIAVGNVVLNRVKSKDYPNTIYGVIYDKKYGVQFSPVADGTIKLEPDADSVIAAKLCLEGYTVSTSILFFINKNIATNMWVTNTRPLAVSIGKHDFYA